MPEDTFPSEVHLKIGSCSACRRARARCEREESPGGTPQRCVRCIARDEICQYPTYRAGRKRGSLNKRSKSDSQIDDFNDLLGFSVHTYATEPPQPVPSTSLTIPPPVTTQRPNGMGGGSLKNNPLRYIQEVNLNGKGAASAPGSRRDYFDSPRSVLDVGPDKDPIDLGLVTLEEATRLFSFARTHLSYLKYALDDEWYTFERVRSRSALLFNAILARAAGFSNDGAAISTRLRNHGRRIILLVFNGHYRSMELVLALLVIMIWCPAFESEMDDPTPKLISLSLDMALALQMDRVIRFPGSTEPQTRGVFDAEQVMTIDAMDIHAMSDMDIQRHLRSRQRIFFNVFVHDPGINMIRGLPSRLPIGPLVDSCDQWHLHPTGIPTDYAIIGGVVLIRDKEVVLDNIRQLGLGSGPAEAESIDNMVKALIENYFNSWMAKWRDPLQGVGATAEAMLAGLEQLASNLRLSTYVNLIAQREKQGYSTSILVSAAIDAAIAVLHVPLRYEAYMATVSNTVCAFVAFASAFVLKSKFTGVEMSREASTLIPWLPEAALNLIERVSSTPPHRHGVGVHYAQQVRAHFLPEQTDAQQSSTSQGFPQGESSGSSGQSGWSTGGSYPTASSTTPYLNQGSVVAQQFSQSAIPVPSGPSSTQSARPSQAAQEMDWLEWVNQVDPTQPA